MDGCKSSPRSRSLSLPEASCPYLVRKTGGCGAATVVGGGRGQVPEWAAHSGVDTVADTLVFITALGLPKGGRPVWGAGGWGLPSALLLPAGCRAVRGDTLSPSTLRTALHQSSHIQL